MTPQPLWHDTFESALADTLIAVYGKGWWKKAAGDMCSTEDPTDKGKWLQKALDPTRAEKLGINDILWILKRGREHGIHTAMFYLTNDCNYTQPTPIEPEDQRAILQRDFIDAVDRLEIIKKQWEKAR